jgi:hypothetical protein
MEATVTCMICGSVFMADPFDWRGLGKHAESHIQEDPDGD